MIKNLYLVLISFLFIIVNYLSFGNNVSTTINQKGKKTIKNKTAGNDIKIGSQVWMVKNLNVDKFRNGNAITQAKSKEDWIKAGLSKQPAWCYYNNDPQNGTKYGKLYNWYAVNDPRGLAPKGYHVPSDAEWTTLLNVLGDKENAGRKLKSKEGWNENGNGNNESGFSGLPCGNRGSGNASFGAIGVTVYWWSSTEGGKESACIIGLNCYYNDFSRICGGEKASGFSVRCIKN